MPELPEVETIVRGLSKTLKGDQVTQVQVLRKDSIAYPDTPEEFAKMLKGRTFQTFDRRGKYMLLGLDAGAGLGVHLRMSGRLLVRSPKQKDDHSFLRVRMKLASGRELHYEDMRVFGRLWFVPKTLSFDEVIPALQNLGVEPINGNLTGAILKELFARKTQAVKSALLDQTLISGVGNIYADEALFLSGIRPLTRACDITGKKLNLLAEQIDQVLCSAIKAGGSTLRDYTDSDGVNGNYQNQAWVYGRKGEECRVCGKAIERVKIAGRSAHFCTKCQK